MLLFLAAAVAMAESSPFAWDTVLDMGYSFCYTASGPDRSEIC